MANVVDQSQLQSGTGAGFGEFLNTRYRGMGFTPSKSPLTAVQFQRAKGGQGIKIYIDSADTDSIPTHAVGSELYSFTVTNAELDGSFQIFNLPVSLTVTPGSQYCFYIAPWNTTLDLYADDYQDMQWKNSNVYSGGKPIVNNTGTWSVSDAGNLDAYFQTYTLGGASGFLLMGVG